MFSHWLDIKRKNTCLWTLIEKSKERKQLRDQNKSKNTKEQLNKISKQKQTKVEVDKNMYRKQKGKQ